jgi:hypothetical protein
MSYKFYLELLRGSLYTEFFEEIRTGVVAFMDPEVYGRSPLEVSSFIVSSVFPDEKMHGKVSLSSCLSLLRLHAPPLDLALCLLHRECSLAYLDQQQSS